MIILGRHTSYNVQKVLWLADEMQLEYEHKEVGGRFGGNDTEEFLKLNPLGNVPVLVDQGQAIRESNTIVRYLADTQEPDKWIPRDPLARTRVNEWMDWSIDRLEQAFVGVFWGYYRTPIAEHNLETIEQSLARVKECLGILDDELGDHEFIIGSSLTLADIVTGVYLFRLANIDLDIPFPSNLARWFERLSERPAYQRWVMSDFSELKGRSVN